MFQRLETRLCSATGNVEAMMGSDRIQLYAYCEAHTGRLAVEFKLPGVAYPTAPSRLAIATALADSIRALATEIELAAGKAVLHE